MVPDDGKTDLVIRTSVKGWLAELAKAYRERAPFLLEDDAQVGVDPRSDSLLRMGLKAKLSQREWVGVLISLGVAGVGAWLIVMAVLDPEPYSKVASAIAAGAALLGSGGLVAVKILTHITPPSIRVNPRGGFEIFWA